MVVRRFGERCGCGTTGLVHWLPAEEAVGVEAGAGGREDVQEGMDGGGGVTQVQNKIYQILGQRKKTHIYYQWHEAAV